MDSDLHNVTAHLEMRTGFFIDDWYLIGTDTGSRITNADIEGTSAEMREIAYAIEQRGSFMAKRCAVRCSENGVELWSPRNSMRSAFVSYANADALAAQITKELGCREAIGNAESENV